MMFVLMSGGEPRNEAQLRPCPPQVSFSKKNSSLSNIEDAANHLHWERAGVSEPLQKVGTLLWGTGEGLSVQRTVPTTTTHKTKRRKIEHLREAADPTALALATQISLKASGKRKQLNLWEMLRKEEIQSRFPNEMGLLVDQPKPGESGNSNNGNTPRRYFSNPELTYP
ncbi:hypothetical protein ANN_01582 [Periplaneta americana]|uniref:Uncharacterized protein n=1 Tax=Periplaneta americana TaxID=6978 RepID=A0ABQ8TTZ5_PERAM|nr:hypothetical protein ANN_01582 [Periplaneta americana]